MTARWIPALALCWASVAPAAAGLDDRLAQVAAAGGNELAYTEERSSALFDAPVTFTGRLEYEPATGHFTKWVETPEPARMTVTPTRIEMQTGEERVRRIALSTRPELAAFLDGFRALLSGDASALDDGFETEYEVLEEDHWRLRLTPVHRRISADVALLTVLGEGDRLTRIDTEMTNGETHRMILHPVGAEEVIAPADDPT